MRQTKHRQEILHVMETTHGTLSASDIHCALPHINLVTVYRTLETFVEAGLIKKLHFDSKEAVYEFQNHPHYHAICTDCEKVTHFTIDSKKLTKALGLSNFSINDVEILVRGQCTKRHS